MKNAVTLFALAAISLAACRKKECQQNPKYDLQSELQGHYNQVGFKSSLFPSWSYTSTGPQFDIIGDSITGIYATSFEVLNNQNIRLDQPDQLVKITFGDTVVFAFQNGDSTKLIKY